MGCSRLVKANSSSFSFFCYETMQPLQFGKIGAAGATQVKDFADEDAASRYMDRQEAAKRKKGALHTAIIFTHLSEFHHDMTISLGFMME